VLAMPADTVVALWVMLPLLRLAQATGACRPLLT